MQIEERSNQDIRYGVTIEMLAKSVGKSEQTIYVWQRNQPALLSAAAKQVRDRLWPSADRIVEAHRRSERSPKMIAHLASFGENGRIGLGDSPFPSLHRLMFSLPGSDFWCLKDVLRVEKSKGQNRGHSYADLSLISDAADIQHSLLKKAGGDLVLMEDIFDSLIFSTNATLENFPEVTDACLVSKVLSLIERKRMDIERAIL